LQDIGYIALHTNNAGKNAVSLAVSLSV
jgi:hypothetical protein